MFGVTDRCKYLFRRVMMARIILYRDSRAWLPEGLLLKLMNLYYYLPTTFETHHLIVVSQQIRDV
ncbi:hypothetical protein Syun_027863 [Stephania yunnanensis]|uniref:Uncharacterized protein n=1 Tax=Stephania yunnanensis TaxID=152371 RepID=A0AAP0HQB6_9MAGN